LSEYGLASCLRGEIPASVDWEELIRQANEHLVTPRLHAVFRARRDLVADDVREYVQLLHDLNLKRNVRLKEQALEAIGALNAAGILPTLLKGTIILLTCPADELGSRMTSDLDVLLTPSDLPRASEILRSLSYRDLDGNIGEHAHAKFYRPQDAGMIDLHHRPPGPGKLYPTLQLDLGEAATIDGRSFCVPAPTSRVVHLIAHDMFNDGGLSCGRMQLRHLFDIADLLQREQVDWASARARFSAARLSLAFDVYLLTLVKIAKAGAADIAARNVIAHLFFHRQMLMERSDRFRLVNHMAVRTIRSFRQRLRGAAMKNTLTISRGLL
jgi:hypothetical protein